MIRADACRGRRDRAVSTVLDAAVFLLLVSAAIGLLYAVPQSEDGAAPDPDVAEAASATLATSIATVEYVPAPAGEAVASTGGADVPAGRREASVGNRSDRGTIAELLAETTVANARVGGEAFTRAPNHERAIQNATRRVIGHFGDGVAVQVRTRWRPLPGSGLRADLAIGPSPPDDADVHAATMAVPVGTATSSGAARSDWLSPRGSEPTDRDTAEDRLGLPTGRVTSIETVAEDASCSGLARLVGARAVGTAFPPERTTLSLRAGGSATATTERRYHTAARTLSIDPAGLPLDGRVRAANEVLATTLATRLESTCRGYESPARAAERAAPAVVTVSVRTWSP